MHLRFPSSSLILLIGPSGSGKSTWADATFREGQVLSSDHFRAVVGEGPRDQKASERAFQLVDQLIGERLDAGLLTVVDSLGLNRRQRERHIEMARARGIPVFAVGFDTPAKICKERNDRQGRPVPVGVQAQQLKRWPAVRDEELTADGFDAVHILETPQPAYVVPAVMWDAPAAANRQSVEPKRLSFGLQLAKFPWEDDEFGPMVAAVARRAEEVGFTTLWVMDHLRQIPQVGSAWEPLPEAYTTLAYAAGSTERIRLGTMVTAITYRNVGLLGKMLATLDVLSGGRAVCGLGAGWFEAEARAYGYDWHRPGHRLDVLEDALQALPMIWGPGTKPFTGKVIGLPETLCYPRPLQDPIPILIGGGGEKRTLRLVAQYADATNLFGDPDHIRHKLGVLREHCVDVGRDVSEIEVTALTSALTQADHRSLSKVIDAILGGNGASERFAADIGAGTPDEQIGRFRAYADAGVDTMILGVAGLQRPDDLEPYRDVIAAFR